MILRRVVIILISLLGVYLLLAGSLLALMYQPPERFAAAMAKVPPPFFAALPIETLWLFARDGNLKVGDVAPDFQLETFDRKSAVRLSSFQGLKPVVLVFGSYT